MKKIFNISYIALFAVLALFTACTEEDDYTPAPQAKVEENGYRFKVDIEKPIILDLTATEFSIIVERDSIGFEETLELYADADSELNIPTSVTFAADASQAELKIGVSESLQPFVKSQIRELRLADTDEINPYKIDIPYISLYVYKEDYVPYGKGVYNWGFFTMLFGVEYPYEQEIEYSEYLNAFRLPSPFTTLASIYVGAGCGVENGDDVVFQIDEEKGEVILENEVIKSGLIYPSYGSVYANYQASMIMEDGTILFQYNWTVSAGSFGSAVDQLKIVEVY